MQQICQVGNADSVVDCIRKHNVRSITYWHDILERLPQNLSD